MAENNPNTPQGAVPPKPAEGAKVQPKKETVRISLPPKPTASPTIKLPTLPAGGAAASSKPPPAPASGARPASSGTAPGAPRPPTPPPPGTGGARVAGAPTAGRPAPAKSVPVAARRPAAPAALSAVDQGLAIGAAVLSVVALGSVIFLTLVTN